MKWAKVKVAANKDEEKRFCAYQCE